MKTKSRHLHRRVPLIAALAALSLASFAPQALARYVYSGNYSEDSVSVIDSATNQVVGSPIPVGDGPYSMAVAPNGATLYVANEVSEDLTAINTQSNQPTGTFPLGIQPATIAISPDGNTAYVTSQDENVVLVVDLQAARSPERRSPSAETRGASPSRLTAKPPMSPTNQTTTSR